MEGAGLHVHNGGKNCLPSDPLHTLSVIVRSGAVTSAVSLSGKWKTRPYPLPMLRHATDLLYSAFSSKPNFLEWWSAPRYSNYKVQTHFNLVGSSLLGRYAVSTRAELVIFEDGSTTILRNFGNYLYPFAHSDLEEVLNLQYCFQNIKSGVMKICSWSDLCVSVEKDLSFWDPCYRFWFQITSKLTSMKLNIFDKYKNRFFYFNKMTQNENTLSLYLILEL